MRLCKLFSNTVNTLHWRNCLNWKEEKFLFEKACYSLLLLYYYLVCIIKQNK